MVMTMSNNKLHYLLAYKLADSAAITMSLNTKTCSLTGMGNLSIGAYLLQVPYKVTFSYMNLKPEKAGVFLHLGHNLYLLVCCNKEKVGMAVLDKAKLDVAPTRKNPKFKRPTMKASTVFSHVREGIVSCSYLKEGDWIGTEDFDEFERAFV